MSDFRDLVDLAVDKLGGHVLWASDDFFAGKENLLKSTAAVFLEHEYTDRGKWMDGWESLRKRAVGRDIRDEAIIRLGVPGIVRGVVVDTSFFRGNFPEAFELEACQMRSDTSVEVLQSSATEWVKLEPRTPIEGNTLNFFDVSSEFIATHLRLIIYPDGGVARLRVHGTVAPDWRALGGAKNEIDLAALESGGEVLSCSDMFFGSRHNLIMPGRGVNMGDGWETKRSRRPGPARPPRWPCSPGRGPIAAAPSWDSRRRRPPPRCCAPSSTAHRPTPSPSCCGRSTSSPPRPICWCISPTGRGSSARSTSANSIRIPMRLVTSERSGPEK